MEWIEFSDIIGIAISIYVCVLAYNNPHIKRDVKMGFLFAGFALFILYFFDMSWYVMLYKMPISPKTDFWMNFVTCIVYLMLPLAISSFSTLYVHKRPRIRHYIGLIAIILLAIADIVNIFKPIIFYHKDSVMYFMPLGFWMHVLCFIAFLVLLADMIQHSSFDYEDIFLVAFVGVSMFIGLLASWINYDLKTLWVSVGISYLLMYLALSELYNKKDVVTGLPNRNAYEKAMAHTKNSYKTILMADMNRLKFYNDSMGHSAGDQYIYATAQTLSEAFSGCGKLYRVGGDEFCLVSTQEKDALTKIADSLLAKGKCDEKYGDFPIDFAYGIGVRQEGDTVLDVYKKADQLMYEKKTLLHTTDRPHQS